MKQIWEIYKTDWRNIFKVPTGIFLMVALVLLPCIYDWVNLISVWDPYSHTEGIKIAVTSKDEGATVQDKTINIGNEVMESLKNNKKLGWTFVSEEQARKGVDRGDYYASILIPADFSKKITSIVNGVPEKPEVEYTVNEKINAVAPKITNSGVSTVTAQINENFVKTVSETALAKLKEVGIKVEQELPTIRRIENAVFDLEKSLPEITAAGQKVLEVEQKLPEINAKAQKIVDLEDKIPQINQAGDALLKIEERWPKINEAAGEVVKLQSRLPEIQKAADRVSELDQNFNKVEEALNNALTKTQKAAEIVSAAQQALPKLEKIAEAGGAFANSLQDFLEKNDAALQALPPIIKQNLILLQQTADAVTQLTEQLQNANLDPKPALEVLSFLKDRLTTGVQVLSRTTDLLKRLNTYVESTALTDLVKRLGDVETNFNEQIQLINSITSAIQKGEQPAKSIVDRLHTLSKEASSMLGDVLSRYDSEIVPNLTRAFEQVKSIAKNASDVLQIAKNQLPNIKEILNDAQAGIQFGQEQIQAMQQDLPRIKDAVHQSAVTLQQKMGEFTAAVNAAVPFIQNQLPNVEQKVHQAADFVRVDLPRLEDQLHQLSDFVQNKLPELEEGVHKVADLVRNDLPGLEDSVRKAADKIREVKGQANLEDLAKLLRGDIQKESDFLANPVQIKEQRKYPIPNYGSAMSPFYGVLSLWVGATLLISLLRVDVEETGRIYKGYQLYFGRLLTFLTVGFFQALSMTLGDIFILDAYVVNKIWFVLFAILISNVFVTITYTLLSVFGNTGKGIAILFLVLQFSSSGGTFPISTTSSFFQKMNPLVPFTYAISLLREAVGGILWETVVKDVICLILFIGLSYLLALALKKPLSKYTKHAAEKAKETKVIS